MALQNRAAGDESDRRAESKSFGTIRLGTYTHKSYIQKKDGKTWSLVINISGMSKEMHTKIAWKLFFYAIHNETSKDDIRVKRDLYMEKLVAGKDISDEEDTAQRICKWDE